MIQTMKRRKLRQHMEKVHAILADPKKFDALAGSEALLYLNRFMSVNKDAVKAATIEKAADPLRRSARTAFREEEGGKVILSGGGLHVSVTQSTYFRVINHLRNGKKIHAIKEIRADALCGLHEAKVIVESDTRCVQATVMPVKK